MTDKKTTDLFQQMNEQILDSIADGVFTVDNNWNITSFNRAAEKITGVSRKNAIGSKCWEVFHAEVCERDCFLKKTLKTRKSSINNTIHIVNRAGKTLPVSISTAMLSDKSGTIIGGVETFRDLSEIEELRREVAGKNYHYDMITNNHRMLDLLNNLPVIAKSDSPVLISGESGTGKELLAKAIHHLSLRKDGPFVAINCGALPENLLESELFGYKKGAFTDAKSDKPGRFDKAKGGTLFLDEIGDMPKVLQVKLLRVLQEHIFEPLGTSESVESNVRIVAATNRDLINMVKNGEFRQDLFYRIHVMPLTLPPLRERTDDIPILVNHFIAHNSIINKSKTDSISPDALSILAAYSFPGNIRELENILQHAMILCQGKIIETKHLPVYLLKRQTEKYSPVHDRKNSIKEFEKSEIVLALEKNFYNRIKTAEALGIHVATLWRKMKKYDLSGL